VVNGNDLNENEEWRAIPGYEGRYEVSNLGRVKTFLRSKSPSGRLLTIYTPSNGYPVCSLYSGQGRGLFTQVGSTVLETFVCPRQAYHVVAYRDGDKVNLRLSNLFWRYVGCDDQAQPTLPGEEWRPAYRYEGNYEVSNLGRIRSLLGREPGRIIRARKSPFGYYQIVLKLPNGVERNESLQTLVLEAFVGPRPLKLEANHIDGDKANNAVTNLAWSTSKENHEHRYKILGQRAPNAYKPGHPSGRCGPGSKLTKERRAEIEKKLEEGGTLIPLSKEYDVSISTIARIRRDARNAINKERANLPECENLSSFTSDKTGYS